MCFSHMLLNRGELLQGFVDGDPFTLLLCRETLCKNENVW